MRSVFNEDSFKGRRPNERKFDVMSVPSDYVAARHLYVIEYVEVWVNEP